MISVNEKLLKTLNPDPKNIKDIRFPWIYTYKFFCNLNTNKLIYASDYNVDIRTYIAIKVYSKTSNDLSMWFVPGFSPDIKNY